MNMNMRGAAVLLVMLPSTYALAQAVPENGVPTTKVAESSDQALETVIVTGTRRAGLKAADSPAPIQVIDVGTLARTGSADLIRALAENVPSFTADGKGGDAAALTVAARLRGLSPNHTLVLINGKRRHGTSNLNVSGSAFQGGAAADLSLIPVSAIDHIEVLQDGAAAQYGSDAIAGVINIILKANARGGVAGVKAGQYFEGDGKTGSAAVNLGLQPTEDAFLSLTGETQYRGHSDRSDYDARFVPPYLKTADANVVNVPGYPHVNHTFGDPRVRQDTLAANAGLDLGSAQLYSFATFARKTAEAIQNYRGPSTAYGVYPLGFSPVETHDEDDYAITAGIKGKTFANWYYDFSTTYGRDNANVGNIDSLNVQLWKDTGSTQSDFDEGFLKATQSTTNLDFNREFDVGWATPVNVALGYEHRVDGYAIGAGEPASTYRGGAAAFPGFTTTDAGSHLRHNNALYADVSGTPTDSFKLDAAVRTERYDDFGSATVGKLTARNDFTPTFALRGTVSNGFRAPTLAEDYYSATQVSPTTATVLLPSSAAAARYLGLDALKPEKSQNFSIGLVAKPAAKVTATLDIYQINIKDRILQSGTIYGLLNNVQQPAYNAVTSAITANGNSLPSGITSSGVSIYSNAADTTNHGADFVLTYADDYAGLGKVDWTVAANYNRVKVTSLKPNPSQLGNAKVLDQTAISYLETASPRYRINLGALWTRGEWTVSLRENVFGPSAYYASVDNITYYENRIHTKYITDVEVTDQFTKAWSVSLGANNLFNVYPDELNARYRTALNNAGRQNVAKYASFSPIGINGGFYYLRANYKF